MYQKKEHAEENPTVIYHSLDFDGCFSNETLLEALGQDWTSLKSIDEVNSAYLTANRILLDSFKRDNAPKTVLLVGSNRQNPFIDLKNGTVTGTQCPSGSVYPRMEALANSLNNTTFNPFLLSDLEIDRPKEGTYNKIKKYLNENGSYPTLEGSYLPKLTPKQLEIDGNWNFENIQDSDLKKLTEDFPQKGWYMATRNIDWGSDLFLYLKKQHFIPIPSARSANAYNYGETTRLESIQGKGSIPEEIADWQPAYNAMRQVSKDEVGRISVARCFSLTEFITQLADPATGVIPKGSQEYLDSIIETKLSILQEELTLDKRDELELSLIELYKVKIKSDNIQLQSKNIPIDLDNTRTELYAAISEKRRKIRLINFRRIS